MCTAAPSPRLQRCLESAEAAGASRDWLERNYPKAHSATLNQIYRVLCLAGPQGCSVKGMVLKATEYQLGFAWDDNTNQRSAITQSLHTMSGRSMVGVTGEPMTTGCLELVDDRSTQQNAASLMLLLLTGKRV